MIESYLVGCYWCTRSDSRDECATRTEALFQGLARLHPFYARWFARAMSRKKALQTEFKLDAQTLRMLFARKKHAVTENTTLFGAWNGRSQEEGGAVDIKCGVTNPEWHGECFLRVPSTGPFAEQMLTVPALVDVLKIMIHAWDPDHAIATSTEHHMLVMKTRKPGDFFLGWIMYFPRRLGPLPPLPEPVRVEPVEDKGSLVILTPEKFTVSNLVHVRLAAQVWDILVQAGFLKADCPP